MYVRVHTPVSAPERGTGKDLEWVAVLQQPTASSVFS